MRPVFSFAIVVLTGTLFGVGVGPASADGNAQRLETQATLIRGQLDRVNAEIAELKRTDRGVGGDYRLRQKMADAEALARKLTEAEAEVRRLRGTAPDRPVNLLGPTPVAGPQDGPVELAAKADLLADQARRLVGQAQSLTRAAEQIRNRQALRRRAGQIERDPFAGLDASKRNMVFSARASRTLAGDANKSGPGTTGTTTDNSSVPSADLASSPEAAAPPPPQQGAPSSTSAPSPATSAPPAGAPARTAGETSGSPAPTSDPGAAGTQTGASTGTAPTATTPASAPQYRTLLDPATLAEIRRLESAGGPQSNAEALEKAAAALRARAQDLDSAAKTLRARATTNR